MQCILPQDIKELRRAIATNGGFAKLRNMTAKERVDFFAKYVDTPGTTSTAEWLNREIERRVLQPSQIQATKEWLQKLEKKKDVKISNKTALIDRIIKKKEVFNSRGFYADGLVKQALGFETSQANAKKLYDLSVSINEYKKRLLALEPKYLEKTRAELEKLPENVKQARMELGKKLVEFQKEYEAINLEAQLKDYATKTWGGKKLEDILSIAGNIKSLKASVDISYLRQIQSAFYVNTEAASDAWKAGGKAWISSKEEVDTLMAEILTRPNALADRYGQFGVEVGIKEEAFPESWLSQSMDKNNFEWFNVFRRSESAFNVAVQTARANLFDWMWENSKGDVKLLKQQKVGEAINILTGRGKIPLLTPNDPKSQRIINNLLFAPKWLASRVQLLTDFRFNFTSGNKITIDGKTVLTPQGIRAKAAVGNIIIIALLTALAGIIWGISDDDDRKPGTLFDPRSSDFGKVVVGRTRFDLTTGTASLITLFARLLTRQTRTGKGVIRPVEWQDVIGRFLEGKKAPSMQIINNALQEVLYFFGLSETAATDFMGKEYKVEDWLKIIGNYVAPISLESGVEAGWEAYQTGLGKEQWAAIGGFLADIVGIGANTYEKK